MFIETDAYDAKLAELSDRMSELYKEYPYEVMTTTIFNMFMSLMFVNQLSKQEILQEVSEYYDQFKKYERQKKEDVR